MIDLDRNTDFLYSVVIESNGVPDVITELISYDPQRLLTDQRSLYKKLADNPAALADIAKQVLGEPFKMFPHQEHISEVFASGGIFTPTGRHRPIDAQIPYMLPGDEIVLTKRREPTFVASEVVDFGAIDYTPIERRVMSSLKINVSALDNMSSSSLVQARAAAERFNAKFADLRAQYEAAVINGMFAVYIRTERRPMTRSQRVEYLMRSKDPRQRKRGARMAKDEFRRVFGDLPSNWNRSTHRMDFSRDTPLGETYDPARYRKD